MRDLFGYDLYGGEPPAQRHSSTSKAAAAKIKHRIGQLHHKLMDYLRRNSLGATDEEMQADIPMPANTQRPRRVELTQMGLVKDSGRRRLTGSRREAVVWEVMKKETPAGYATSCRRKLDNLGNTLDEIGQ